MLLLFNFFGALDEPALGCCVCFAAVPCHMPANGESVTISTVPTVPVDMSLSLLKRTMSAAGEPTGHSYCLHAVCMIY